MGSFPPLKSALRTLDVLIVLNRSGTMPLRELHRATGIPKPTLIRILETLVLAGLVAKAPSNQGYKVTSKITMLSTGLEGAPRIVALAARHVDPLAKRIRWPISVATLDIDAMVVRYSTIPSSSLGYLHASFERRLSLVGRAAGRAYLAFCSKPERRHLLGLLQRSSADEDRPSRDRRTVARIVRETRANGFAACASSASPPTSTIAVPISSGDNVLATLGATYLSQSVKLQRAADEFVPLLQSAARQIQAEID